MDNLKLKRKEAARSLSDALFNLYSSPELGGKLMVWIDTLTLNDDLRYRFIHCFGDVILGFYQTKDLPNLLQTEVGISPDVAQRIVADLAEFLSPVLEREAALINPKLGAMKELHQQFQQAGGTGVQGAEPEPIEPTVVPTAPAVEPEPIHNVTPMRTMAADMTRVHGYGAYRQVNPQPGEDGVIRTAPQDELLKERPRLTNTPQMGS